jgi:hypothetical protein
VLLVLTQKTPFLNLKYPPVFSIQLSYNASPFQETQRKPRLLSRTRLKKLLILKLLLHELLAGARRERTGLIQD